MRKSKKMVICITLVILLFLSIILMRNYKNGNNIELEKVKLINNKKINNENLAIMVQKEDLSGYEEADTFPTGLTLNSSLSGCIDKDGNTIGDAIEYNIETKNLKLKSKGSSYCYLYFVRDNEAPTINVNIIDNNYTTSKLSISSSEDGTYCINTSSTSNDMTNCVFEGNLLIDTEIITNSFTSSNIYYVHVKDSAGNETISEALDIKVLYQKLDYIETTGTQYIDSGVAATNSSIDFTLQFTDSSVETQAVIGARVSSSAGATKYNIFWNNTNAKTLRLDWNGLSSNSSYSSELSLNTDVNVKLNSDASVVINGTSYTSSSTKSALTKTLYIGNFNNNGTPYSQGVYAKWKTVKIYTSGTLVRDFIPVYRISDNVVGLYDKVNDKFYTNSGNGTIGKGNNIE